MPSEARQPFSRLALAELFFAELPYLPLSFLRIFFGGAKENRINKRVIIQRQREVSIQMITAGTMTILKKAGRSPAFGEGVPSRNRDERSEARGRLSARHNRTFSERASRRLASKGRLIKIFPNNFSGSLQFLKGIKYQLEKENASQNFLVRQN